MSLLRRSQDTTEQMGAWVEKSMYGKSYMGIDRSTYLVGKDGRLASLA
jgi:peroxiredoxin Q/BCP